VEVEAEFGVVGGSVEGFVDGREMVGGPDGKWGVVGDEIGADFGFFGFWGFEGGEFHEWQKRV
jgi:hypothetical protein